MFSSRIVLNQQQIEAINWRNLQRMETELTDLQEEEMEVSPEQLQMMYHLDKLAQEPRYNKDGILYEEPFYEALKQQINTSVPDDIQPVQCAVAVQNALIRAWPTMAGSYRLDEIGELDRFAVSVLKLGEPVWIYCQDVSGLWSYIQNTQVCGWVLSDSLALEPDAWRWQQYCSSRDQVVVADSRRILEYVDFHGIAQKQMLMMGTRLPLYDATRDTFLIGLPIRDQRGNLATLQVMVPRDGSLVPGWMPISAQNIISQAKKMLGEPYGWGGSNFHRDCTSLVSDVYAVFGLLFPRNSRQQMQMFGIENCPVDSTQKYQFISSLMPGAVLYFPGHAMLYLGQTNGELEILHSVYAIGLPDKETLVPHKIRRVVEGHLHQQRVSGETLFDAVKAVWVPDHQKQFLDSGR
ncbi:MAG: SH3 domain-containing protein [Peptococcaceae bacterium]|nr:SH3 domain-containing protein [Peptococcaceae bacterium]